ncbi:hypothetical protein [Streptomyces orinoci]|uniref:Uncharacterized protein n=1 Tax=Streptomyces orinoci TaxID=67339 RepID=A0ABV3K4N0_STRON|nr:hypothetical protein [Streptomyces orinoci]
MPADRPHEADNDILGHAWWAVTPERWSLLQFEPAHNEGLPTDRWWKDRRDVLETLILAPGPIDHGFAHYLLDQETQFHRHCWGFSHSIEIAALLLAEHRRPNDIWHLWQAVTTSFDTWCGLPHRLLLAGGGTARTVAYVAGSGHGQRHNLLEHLREIPETTDDDVTALIAERRRHYTELLTELRNVAVQGPQEEDFGPLSKG